MRVDDISLSSTWNDLEMTTENLPQIVKTVDRIASKEMQEMTISASGRIEGKGTIDSDGKKTTEIGFSIDF